MTLPRFISIFALLAVAVVLLAGFGQDALPFWSQWGSNPAHTGMVNVDGQPLNTKLADIIYDPFVNQEKTENQPLYGEGVLSAHYQSTLIDGDSFYMLQKTGSYVDCQPLSAWVYGGVCGPNAWNWLIWNVARYDWSNGTPTQSWLFTSDWKPEPNDTDFKSGAVGLIGWEPVFHPALANGYLYVPGASGTVWKVDKQSGASVSQINPFASISTNPALTYVSSPLTASADGNIYYNVLELSTDSDPWQQSDIAGAWLVKILPDDTSSTVTYATLTPGAPEGIAKLCPSTFSYVPSSQKLLPWPPTPTSIPPRIRCGSQRPSVNLAPAVGADGTIYTASTAHLDMMVSYLIAVNPDLTLKWAASLQHRLSDGCGILLPIAPQGVTNMPNSCRFGTAVGVDPSTNQKGSGYLSDQASSSPTALPDGSVVMPVTDDYNYGRGHLMHFDSQGNYLNAYTFGWDSTPAVYQHDGTYSLVTKDNHYPSAAYCSFPGFAVCKPLPEGPYYLSQIDPNMNVEWSFQNTDFNSSHPNGYEWCVNAPAIDGNGVVYVTSEDGSIYSIPQGHHGVFTTPKQSIFLLEALGAAYTPLAIGEDGKEYSQNDGHLFIVGK